VVREWLQRATSGARDLHYLHYKVGSGRRLSMDHGVSWWPLLLMQSGLEFQVMRPVLENVTTPDRQGRQIGRYSQAV
jgi:hypothetical protein